MNTGEQQNTDDLSLDNMADDLSIDLGDFETISVVPDKPVEKTEGATDTITANEGKLPETVVGKEGLATEPQADESISSPGDSDETLSKYYSSLATHMRDKGVLPNLAEDAEVTSLEQLTDAVSNEIQTNAGTLQAEYKKAMEGGANQSDYVSYKKTEQELTAITPEMLASEDERAINLRKNIIGQDFLNRGFTREEAVKYAQRSIDIGEDAGDAETALLNLKEYNTEQYNKSVLANKAEEETVQTDIKKFIDNTDEVIKGSKLSPNIKTKLLEQIITPVGNDKNGKPINAFMKAYQEDPIKFQVMQNYLYMVSKGFTDFSKVSKIATTKASKEMDDLLRNAGSSFAKQGNISFDQRKNETSFTIGDGFNIDV